MLAEIFHKLTVFLKKKVLEILGLGLVVLSILLFFALASYSPEDPNFLYLPQKTEITNLLGFYGSVVADFILQSFGLIFFLFLINILWWGIMIFKTQNFKNFISQLFFSIIYIVAGSSAISIYKDESFWLIDNGNGGFVGRLTQEIIVNYTNSITINNIVYVLGLICIIFFILSINLKIKHIVSMFNFFILFIKKIFTSFKKNDENNLLKENDAEEIFQTSNKKPVAQPGLPFDLHKKQNDKIKIYNFPPLNFLEKNSDKRNTGKNYVNNVEKNSEVLEKILLDFGIEGKIKKVSCGPVVTLYEFEPAPGVRVARIMNLSDDIARNTSSVSTRVAIIPGKNTVGIEIPNSKREKVFLNEIISDARFNQKEFKLPIALGKGISGLPVVADLATMPHLLVAGTTGSGKSVCINSIILSLLYRHTPQTCNLILIDPKMLELSTYEGIPHLLCPVITEAKKATAALGWIVREMENRYKLMTSLGVKNIDGYNAKKQKLMPYIVVIVDEMSDLMLIAGKEIENYIQKLSQMARAAGIHIIMATQRPSVDVITGTIKANFPTRISFQVSSKIDSRTILGEQGAEQLLGKGDMLFMSSANRIIRIHGPFVSEIEIEKINSFLRSQDEPNYFDEITTSKETNNDQDTDNEKKDELYLKALELVRQEGKASTSFLQRKLQIGYNRAARIIDMMEKEGIVSQANHVGKREIL